MVAERERSDTRRFAWGMVRHSVLYGVLEVRSGGIGQGTGTPFLIHCGATLAAGFDRPQLAESGCSIWVVFFLPSPLAGDEWDQALLIGQFLQLYGCLANVDHHPVDL